MARGRLGEKHTVETGIAHSGERFFFLFLFVVGNSSSVTEDYTYICIWFSVGVDVLLSLFWRSIQILISVTFFGTRLHRPILFQGCHKMNKLVCRLCYNASVNSTDLSLPRSFTVCALFTSSPFSI